jgi:DNA-binding transcriptional LysR family regulator
MGARYMGIELMKTHIANPLDRRDVIVRPDKLQWDDIRMFLRVVEAGSTRLGCIRAGVALNTARSAIDRLEHRFGQPLLVRTVEGVTPTDAGKQIVALAEDMARLVAALDGSQR